MISISEDLPENKIGGSAEEAVDLGFEQLSLLRKAFCGHQTNNAFCVETQKMPYPVNKVFAGFWVHRQARTN